MTDVPLKGNLTETRLPLVLIYINRRRLSGTLVVKTPLFTKKIFLIKGDAIFSSSTNVDDRLGETLLKVGKITIEQFDAASEEIRKGEKRLGAILVDLGFLTPKELFWGVKYQVREIIYSIFQIEDGEYEFVEGAVPEDEVITLKMSMGNLIYEGVKRITSLTRIRREMPSMRDVLMLSDDPISLFQNIELGSNDKKLLSLVDGQKTIKEILDSSWMSSFDAMKILYVLFYTGILVMREHAVAQGETITVDDLLSEEPADAHKFEKRVEEFLMKIGSENPYDMIEVDPSLDPEGMKKAYFRLAKEFHPDKYYDSDDVELRDKLTTIFDAVTEAYNRIKSLEAAKTKQAEALSVEEEENAEQMYQQGIASFKSGQFEDSLQSFRAAVDIDKKSGKYWSSLSLAYTKIKGGVQKAEEALMEAIKLEPDNADYLANLGLIYMMSGMKPRAKTQFEKALMLDGNNKRAQKGLQDLAK